MSDALVAAGLRKWFGSGAGRVIPIDGVDLLISRGELVVLTGPSGSGKSTLLQMLAGFQQPDEGRVQWAGCAAGPPPWDVVAMLLARPMSCRAKVVPRMSKRWLLPVGPV